MVHGARHVGEGDEIPALPAGAPEDQFPPGHRLAAELVAEQHPAVGRGVGRRAHRVGQAQHQPRDPRGQHQLLGRAVGDGVGVDRTGHGLFADLAPQRRAVDMGGGDIDEAADTRLLRRREELAGAEHVDHMGAFGIGGAVPRVHGRQVEHGIDTVADRRQRAVVQEVRPHHLHAPGPGRPVLRRPAGGNPKGVGSGSFQMAEDAAAQIP